MSYQKKRAKLSTKSLQHENSSTNTILYPNFKLYFVPGRIQSKRLQIMKNCAEKNGYCVSESFGPEVTHVLTDFETEEQVLRNLQIDLPNDLIKKVQLLSTKWFTDSIKLGKPITPTPNEYRIIAERKTPDPEIVITKIDYNEYNCYACQRKTPLIHHNHLLTDALDVVARHAELRDAEGDYVRALAFNKAAAVLKSFPSTIVKASEAAKLKDIGKHSLKIIKEILEDGFSSEVDQIKNDPWFIAMQIFSSVFGVGPVLANQWYSVGYRSIEQVKNLRLSKQMKLSGDVEKINHGLAFHADLTTPVTIAEANSILEFFNKEANKILPGVKLDLTGGFRRGKQQGHDVDILFTHPTQGKEVGFLQQLHYRLMSLGFILYGYVQKSSFSEDKIQQELNNLTVPQNANVMDDFEKCFYILRMPTLTEDFGNVQFVGTLPPPRSEFSALCSLAEMERNWRAVRVDLILTPRDQHAFALVGWTGNKNFNRSVRNYAKKVLNMKLTSHGLWSYDNQRRVTSLTEEDVFTSLNLKYMEPWERNV